MTKKQRLESVLKAFNEEERELLESLGVRRLYRALDTQPVDSILVAQLRSIIPQLKQKMEEVAKAKAVKKEEKAKAIKEARDKENIELVEDIEFHIPKYGMFALPKPIFELFAQTFGFDLATAHRKVVNLFIYFPKRVPLIAINIDLDSYMLETLFVDALEEYLLLEDEEKNYSTFCGKFSQQVFSLLAALGTKSIRRGDKVVHVTPQVISFEELRDKELAAIEEVIEE
ncbi:MAG TPA: hypothetical protein PKI14_15035 [Fervidobacterium sp.]|nr:hypothetical protein [Fervidobacterium sp.]